METWRKMYPGFRAFALYPGLQDRSSLTGLSVNIIMRTTAGRKELMDVPEHIDPCYFIRVLSFFGDFSTITKKGTFNRKTSACEPKQAFANTGIM
jgi:hypothetical protein